MANKMIVYPTKDAKIGNHKISNLYIMQDGISPESYMGCWDWPTTKPTAGWYGYQGRLLYQYDNLPALPIGSSLIKATLKVHLISAGQALSPYNSAYYQENANPIINVHGITKAWDEGTGDGKTVSSTQQNYAVNWTRAGKNSYWGTYGGDIEATPVASKQITYTTQDVEFDITTLYAKWMNDTQTNNGLMIKYANDQIAQGRFHTYNRESAADGSWWGVPFIEVEYNEPPEPPKALQPSNQSTVSPQWRPLELDWEFVDYEPDVIPGSMDLVVMMDGSRSFYDDLPEFKRKMKLYLDKLDMANIDYRLILVDYRGEYDTYYTPSQSKFVKWYEYGWSNYLFTCSGKTWGSAQHIDNSDIGRVRYYSDAQGYSGTIYGTAVYGRTSIGGTSCSIKGSTVVDTASHTVTFSGTVTKPSESYTVYRGGGITYYEWQTDRQSFEQQLNGFQPNSGDYQPTWEVFLHEQKGVKKLTFREDAEVHLIYVTDNSIKGSSTAHIKSVTDWAVANNYKIWSLVHGSYLNNLATLTQPTGGKNIDLNTEWQATLPIAKSQVAAGNTESGDYQTKAEVSIWSVELDNSRVFLKTINATSLTHVALDPAEIPLVNNKVYEWQVKVYDSSNLAATSSKALFTYRDDVDPWDTEIMWGPLPEAGDIVKRQDLYDLKDNLLQLGQRFVNVRVSSINKLFTGDIVPSGKDTKLLKEILNQMLVDSGMDINQWWSRDFVNDDLLDPDDIQYIREMLDLIHSQGPQKPELITATRITNYISPPATIDASNAGMYSPAFTVSWSNAIKQSGGWRIQTTASPSRDLLFYRLYHNYKSSTKRKNVTTEGEVTLFDSSASFYTYHDFTPQQFEDGGFAIDGSTGSGEVFIESDGATSHNEMWVRAVDGSGHYSEPAHVTISNLQGTTDMGDVQYYRVEYQVGDIDAGQSNPQGVWNLFDDYVTGTSTTVDLKATGTIWFRVCAITTKNQLTDYTYTSVPVHARL